MADELNEQKTFPLKKPVTIGDMTWRELTARELTIGEWDKASKGISGYAADFAVLSVATGAPPAVIEKLSITDFKAVRAYVTGFWDDGQETEEAP